MACNLLINFATVRIEKVISYMKITISRSAGFTLVEIMVVVAVIGLLAAIAIPNFIRARMNAQTNACIYNLHQVDSAIQQYALENGKNNGDPVSLSDLAPYVGRGVNGDTSYLYCPADPAQKFDSSYKIVDFGTVPTCKIVPALHKLK